MALYAIGDLHLSFSTDKPMDVFGENWNSHADKIKEYWTTTVKDEDVVLIPGDISWATTFDDALVDLKWIEDLPGKKVLLKGNHDYWWSSVSKMNLLFESLIFLQNTFFVYEGIAICGARGWDCPHEQFTEHDEKIYKREQIRLKLSLDAAVKQGIEQVLVMMHYPPVYETFEDSAFTEIFESYGVEQVIYGHVHTSFEGLVEGVFNGVDYRCVSSDYLGFKPYRLMD